MTRTQASVKRGAMFENNCVRDPDTPHETVVYPSGDETAVGVGAFLCDLGPLTSPESAGCVGPTLQGLLPFVVAKRRRFDEHCFFRGEDSQSPNNGFVGEDDMGALSTRDGLRADRRPDVRAGMLMASELRERSGSGVAKPNTG